MYQPYIIQLGSLFAMTQRVHASAGQSGTYSPRSRDAYKWEYLEDATTQALSLARANPGVGVTIWSTDDMVRMGYILLS